MTDIADIAIPGVAIVRGPVEGGMTIRTLGKGLLARFAAAVQVSGADRLELDVLKANERAIYAVFKATRGTEDVSARVMENF